MNTLQVMRAPRSVDIAITGRCNLDCKYCFYADEMVAHGDLPTDRWLSFFEELGQLGIMDVVLTGGEVFTRRDLFELVDGLIANRMRYSFLSNGTLITEKTLEQFEVGKRRSRLNSIQISVDGSRAETHNKSRPNSFDRMVRGLKLLVGAGYPVTVRVTINRYNVDELDDIATFLLEEIGIPQFSTNEAYPSGATTRAEGGIRLSHEQRVQAMDKLTELAEKYPGRITAMAGPLAFAQRLNMVDKALAAGVTELPGCGSLTGCGCPSSAMAVLHDGTIVPCHLLSSLHMGTIGEDRLQDIWLNHDTENALRQRRTIPLSQVETCKDCPYQGFCTGNCPGHAVFQAGDFNVRSPLSCIRIFKDEDPFFDPDGNPRIDANIVATRSE